ncbi:hypothetical protein C2845_PM11G25700 [Panicum miliaceum]|uniref:Uncharacterized protein n=1 Tax=Panicum miliaceum TaxID=4540 RepID=A0A3L6RX16_PANMI|nr:hypothetical protein C2845_PM11G25700 [Panicum miliaceum]
MERSRRTIRNSGKSVIDETSDTWGTSSDEESDEETCPGSNGFIASTRSSVKCVVSVVSKFDEKKKELVRSIGFGGILEIPQTNKRLDPDTRTIIVNGQPVADMVDFDVKDILGIPTGPREVRGLGVDDARARKAFLQQMIGAAPNETNSLLAAARVVTKDYLGTMARKQCDNFKVSFVVFVVGHFLAPTTRNNIGNSSFWGALTEPDRIGLYNWGEYVLEQLVDAAAKVQADLAMNKKICNITGCSILLQLRRGPPRKAAMDEEQRNMVLKLARSAHIGSELVSFVKDNFSGKLTETHCNALMVFSERCNTHFDTLKTNIMKESLTLVELLMSGSNTKVKKAPQASFRSRSFDGLADGCRPGVRFSEMDVLNTKNGYESASEGIVQPPSFDLGVEFQSDEAVPLASSTAVGVQGSKIEIPATQKISASAIPGGVKRKSDGMCWSSPDLKFKSSTTSPASLSKTLAEGVVFTRMICSEDEIDVNAEPWEQDAADSPVNKQALEAGRLSKSPWFHGYVHQCYPVGVAKSIFQQALISIPEELERPWIIHRTPRYLEVTGSSILKSFTLQESMSYDIYDLALRCLIDLDSKMYEGSDEKRWRHMFESEFAMLAQADEKAAFRKSVREQFFGPAVTYKLNRCRMFIIPAQVLTNWCCYFWDFKKRCVHIVDPLYKEQDADYYKRLHDPIVNKVGAELANCIDMFFTNWIPGCSEWTKEYVVPVLQVEDRFTGGYCFSNIVPLSDVSKESGLLSLLSIREFDGEGFRNVSKDAFAEFKMVLLGQMLCMGGNEAKVPEKLVAPKPAAKIIHTIDD